MLHPEAFADGLGSLVAGNTAIEVELGCVAGHHQHAFGTDLPIIPSKCEVSPILDTGRERISVDDSVSLTTVARVSEASGLKLNFTGVDLNLEEMLLAQRVVDLVSRSGSRTNNSMRQGIGSLGFS